MKNLNNDSNFRVTSFDLVIPYTNNTIYGACTVHTIKPFVSNNSAAEALSQRIAECSVAG